MINVIEELKKLKAWWRTEINTEIIVSDSAINDLFNKIEEEEKNAFFIIDSALKEDDKYNKIFAQKDKYLFDATLSEPKTGDVNKLVSLIKSLGRDINLVVGIGGGSTIDLTKATSICLANPKKAEEYQGYDMEMAKGPEIWAVPTLFGTGAEITPIAVLRGPERKLGINNKHTSPDVAMIDPQLPITTPKFNRFYTMMDCYYHHYEITKSKTSKSEAILDAEDGLALARELLSSGVEPFNIEASIKAAKASILGGSSTIGGRVGGAHAISYGLSNSSPTLPHSVAVTISMLALENLYPDGYRDTVHFLEANEMPRPNAADYGINESHIEKMVKTSMGMTKLWESCFGEEYRKYATEEFMRKIYEKIVSEK